MTNDTQKHFDLIEEMINDRPESATINASLIPSLIRLPEYAQRELKDFALENPSAYIYTDRDIVEAWLNWNGIFGYTDKITEVVLAIHGKKEN